MSPRLVQTVLARSAFCVSLAYGCLGQAQETAKQRCVNAYEDAQTAKRKGKLIDAKQKLLYCSSAACPAVMHRDCQRWLSDVEDSIPTVVFRIETRSGSPIESTSVSIDGGVPIALDGRAVDVDPGKHEVTLSADGMRSKSKTLVVSEGEKLRQEVVVLDPPPKADSADTSVPSVPSHSSTASSVVISPVPEPSSSSPLVLPIVLTAAVTVLGGVAGIYWGLSARAGERDLDHCSPRCSPENVNGVKRDYLLANVSYGVAAAAAITTTVLIVLSLESSAGSTQVGIGGGTSPLGLSIRRQF